MPAKNLGVFIKRGAMGWVGIGFLSTPDPSGMGWVLMARSRSLTHRLSLRNLVFNPNMYLKRPLDLIRSSK